MTVVVNDAILSNFLRSTFGPVGRDLAARADSVFEDAKDNASGRIIGIESTDLISGLKVFIEQDSQGLYAKIGTAARHRNFGYPAWHDRHGRPWLTKALEVGFTQGIRD